MAGKIIIDTIDTDNAFITLNVQQSLIATMNVSGIYSNTGVKMIGANGTISNTAITGLVTAAQIATVANTQITGNITSSQITSNPTFYGNVSVTGAIGVGGATPAASGSGITFPATQSASTDANTLDDYEEGTFTVGVSGAGTAGTYTISSQTCSYTKIGRLVSLTIYVTGFSAASGGTSYMRVTGLPFTNTLPSKGSANVGFFDFSASTLFVVPAFTNTSGASTLYFEEVKDAANAADFAIAGISTSSNFQLTITYSTS